MLAARMPPNQAMQRTALRPETLGGRTRGNGSTVKPWPMTSSMLQPIARSRS